MVKLTITRASEHPLTREKIILKKTTNTFCSDCEIDWCKIRNKVSYCSQKYRGTNCYSCSDGSCSVKRIAGA